MKPEMIIVSPKLYHWMQTLEAHPESTPYLVKLRHERDWAVGSAIREAFSALRGPQLAFHPFREQAAAATAAAAPPATRSTTG